MDSSQSSPKSDSEFHVCSDACRLSNYPEDPSKMTNRLCKQVSIESPATVGNGKEYVFQYDVMIPDTPPKGARVKV